MDSNAPDISFDPAGLCNYCTELVQTLSQPALTDPANRQRALADLVSLVRNRGAHKRYDCVVGVSGGVDSSWALVQTVDLGLRPLAVHMDNGWDSELAQNNIANLVRTLGVDLYTHVINWEEYRQLMQAFFAADVIDVELLYDNAMLAVNYQQARRHGLKHVLAGTNRVTEGMRLPPGWNWLKTDKRNIKALAKRFGRVRIDTFPAIGTLGVVSYEIVRRIRWVSFLDYLDYNKESALQVLEKEYGFKRYPYKHYESIFTRFYQGYLLPRKFGVDKRRVHFSTLIVAGQLTREAALRDLAGPAYASAADLEQDTRYFLKKMRWSPEDLAVYLSRPARSHREFASERPMWEFLVRLYRRFEGRPAKPAAARAH